MHVYNFGNTLAFGLDEAELIKEYPAILIYLAKVNRWLLQIQIRFHISDFDFAQLQLGHHAGLRDGLWILAESIIGDDIVKEHALSLLSAVLELELLRLSWTLCMAGEQWTSGFVWHQNIMVTQYQPRAMSFFLTWHNLITLMSHCLVCGIFAMWGGGQGGKGKGEYGRKDGV